MISNLQDYRVFCALASSKNTKTASDHLGLSISTISRSTRSLEESLGCELFYRTNHGISLTEAGRNLYSHVSGGIAMLDSCFLQTTTTSQTVTIGISSAYADGFLLSFCLPQFRKEYPQISIQIFQCDDSNQMQSHLNAGTIDFAIGGDPFFANSSATDEVIPLFRNPLIPIIGPNADVDSWFKLTSLPLIYTSINRSDAVQLKLEYSRHGLTFIPMITVSNASQQLELTAAGIGYSFVRASVALSALQTKNICLANVPFSDSQPDLVCMSFPHGSQNNETALHLRKIVIHSASDVRDQILKLQRGVIR